MAMLGSLDLMVLSATTFPRCTEIPPITFRGVTWSPSGGMTVMLPMASLGAAAEGLVVRRALPCAAPATVPVRLTGRLPPDGPVLLLVRVAPRPVLCVGELMASPPSAGARKRSLSLCRVLGAV